MTPGEQRDDYIAKLEKQRDAALIVAMCLISAVLIVLGYAMIEVWS